VEPLTVDPGYFAIELEHLEPATVLAFDLFLWHPGRRPLHYRHRDLEFTREIQARLVANGVRRLLVPAGQLGDFERYRVQHGRCTPATAPVAPAAGPCPAPPLPPAEARLPAVLADPGQPVDRRCAALLGVSRRVVEAAMADLALPGLPERVHHVAEATGRFLMDEPAACGTMVQLMRLDYSSLSHSQHTALYTTELALACGLDDLDEVAAIGRAALLHDIGKAGLPPSITEKDCPPDDPDYPRWREHAMRGTSLLREAGWDDGTCLEVAAHHHENADGSGFPAGLVGAAIPAAARMVRIADAFDSLTTAYRNRPALTGFQALWRMRREMGAQFDQPMLTVFIESLVAPGGARRR
jgi:putative nucleotidyltransferase with HDIG domain